MTNLRFDVKLDRLGVYFAFLVYLNMHEAFAVLGFPVISRFRAAAVNQQAIFELLHEPFMHVASSIIVEAAGQLIGRKFSLNVGRINIGQI